MAKMPMIAIVGRPNVGKSSLLNVLVGKRISIVENIPGVTRDRVTIPLKVGDRYLELVDTGGYGFIDPDKLTDHIHHQIELAMGRADMVLFIVDCQAGLTSADEEIASLLRRKGIKTLLLANKADGTRLDPMLGDFARLGLGTPLGVSAMNGRNIDDVFAAIAKNVDLSQAPTQVPEPEMHIAIVGKRNAGKSTLVNSVAKLFEGDPESVIVSEVPGTTRDSIDVRVEKDGRSLVVIDTAGVRKKRQMVTHDLEFYSYHRAQRSIRRADVVLLLIDSSEPITEPEKKLAQYISEQFKPVVLVVNKWDLAQKTLRDEVNGELAAAVSGGASAITTGISERELMSRYREYIKGALGYLDYAPVEFTTAKDDRKIQTVLDVARHLFNQSRLRLSTGRLNQALRAVLQNRGPSTASGRRAKVFYATQVDTAPPSIVLVVNNPTFFDGSYQRFIINRLRMLLPYPQVPIRLIFRARGISGIGAKSLEDQGEEELLQLSDDRSPGETQQPAQHKPQANRRTEARPQPKSKSFGKSKSKSSIKPKTPRRIEAKPRPKAPKPMRSSRPQHKPRTH